MSLEAIGGDAEIGGRSGPGWPSTRSRVSSKPMPQLRPRIDTVRDAAPAVTEAVADAGEGEDASAGDLHRRFLVSRRAAASDRQPATCTLNKFAQRRRTTPGARRRLGSRPARRPPCRHRAVRPVPAGRGGARNSPRADERHRPGAGKLATRASAAKSTCAVRSARPGVSSGGT